jgi:hypothetical protein
MNELNEAIEILDGLLARSNRDRVALLRIQRILARMQDVYFLDEDDEAELAAGDEQPFPAA